MTFDTCLNVFKGKTCDSKVNGAHKVICLNRKLHKVSPLHMVLMEVTNRTKGEKQSTIHKVITKP